jgi:hypothetical protein
MAGGGPATNTSGGPDKAAAAAQTIDEQAKEVWAKTNDVLAKVDNAHVFSVLKQPCREFPTFAGDEVEGGPHLGRGGFSDVYEVTRIAPSGGGVKDLNKEAEDGGGGEVPESPLPNDGVSSKEGLTAVDCEGGGADQTLHVHYDVKEARQIMAKRCIRLGAARYAIKCLRPDLDKLGHARGALDLAIEIKFLSVLWHPNIIKMRAYSSTSRRVSTDTFIVMGTCGDTLILCMMERKEETNSS